MFRRAEKTSIRAGKSARPFIGRRRILSLLASITILLSGCLQPRTALPPVSSADIESVREAQRAAFLRTDEQRRARLQAAAFPVLRAAVELGPSKAKPTIGIATLTTGDLQVPYRATASRLYGLSKLPQIRAVAPNSPAAKAGLQVGDTLTHVNGRSLADTKEPPIDVLRDALAVDVPLKATVRRRSAEKTMEIIPEALAPYRLSLVYNPEINARATGHTIEVNLGMLEFCKNDTELAFVIAHELAHNALRHQRDLVINYLLGTAADVALLSISVPSANILGLMAFYGPSTSFEIEADYVAMHLLARAGYDLNELHDFWSRMALLGPEREDGGLKLWTHPDPAERQVRYEQMMAGMHASDAP